LGGEDSNCERPASTTVLEAAGGIWGKGETQLEISTIFEAGSADAAAGSANAWIKKGEFCLCIHQTAFCVMRTFEAGVYDNVGPTNTAGCFDSPVTTLKCFDEPATALMFFEEPVTGTWVFRSFEELATVFDVDFTESFMSLGTDSKGRDCCGVMAVSPNLVLHSFTTTGGRGLEFECRVIGGLDHGPMLSRARLGVNKMGEGVVLRGNEECCGHFDNAGHQGQLEL